MKYVLPLALLILTVSSCDKKPMFLKGTSSNGKVAIGPRGNAVIKWEDDAGREFSIEAPHGEFSYVMIAGDKISCNGGKSTVACHLPGAVTKIGEVSISYNSEGDISKVGEVNISYNKGRVIKVGGLDIHYDKLERVTGTSGSVY